MKRFNGLLLAALWLSGFAALEADADIYSWTDENGVRYFTNYAPPKQAQLLMKTPEIEYDEEADLQRREKDELEVARQELAEKEADLLQRQQEAERRIAAANARAEAALREADRILQEAETAGEDVDNNDSSNYAYGYYYPYYGYRYPRKIHYNDYYYYYHGGLHHRKPFYKPRPTLYNRFIRKFDANRYSNAFRSPVNAHQGRGNAFNGRNGRFR